MICFDGTGRKSHRGMMSVKKPVRESSMRKLWNAARMEKFFRTGLPRIFDEIRLLFRFQDNVSIFPGYIQKQTVCRNGAGCMQFD